MAKFSLQLLDTSRPITSAPASTCISSTFSWHDEFHQHLPDELNILLSYTTFHQHLPDMLPHEFHQHLIIFSSYGCLLATLFLHALQLHIDLKSFPMQLKIILSYLWVSPCNIIPLFVLSGDLCIFFFACQLPIHHRPRVLLHHRPLVRQASLIALIYLISKACLCLLLSMTLVASASTTTRLAN